MTRQPSYAGSVDPLDPDDNRPLYVQVADSLAQGITSGEFPPGGRLPSRSELVEFFGVAPMTVQYAQRVLRERGLTVGRQGSGSFVRVVAESPPVKELDELRERVAKLEELVDELRRLPPIAGDSTGEQA